MNNEHFKFVALLVMAGEGYDSEMVATSHNIDDTDRFAKLAFEIAGTRMQMGNTGIVKVRQFHEAPNEAGGPPHTWVEDEFVFELKSNINLAKGGES